MNTNIKDIVIKHLETERDNIKPESNEDEAAFEYSAHLSYVIDALKNNTMSIQDASDELGINLIKE